MTRRPSPRLVHVLPDPAFELCAPGPEHWRIVAIDAQSDDIMHYRCAQRGWQADDIAIAAARLAANGACFCTVQHVTASGIPDNFQRLEVRYAWQRWQVRPW